MARVKGDNRDGVGDADNGGNPPAPVHKEDGGRNTQANKRRNPVKKDETKIKDHNPILKTNKIEKTLKNYFRQKFQSRRCFVIAMQLRNGKRRTMLITTKNRYFKYEGGTYVIDPELSYDNIDSKFMWLDYHQDFCLPIKRDFKFRDVQDAIEQSGMYEVENSTNPSSLTKILEANVGEGIAKSSAMPDFFKRIQIFIIITMLSSIILLIAFIFKTGMLKSIKIPGITG